ncbi:MAG: knotted carbamoyltransferase YgeW [Spirochaetes bacterium]|nr:knotted carbamoyltransferase YgeW [Spirochaetota bacterium]
MDMETRIKTLGALRLNNLYGSDFLLTWDKSDEEISGILQATEILKALRDNNRRTRIFSSGLAVSIFRDKSTRTRFSFAAAANLLGLAVQELDETKSQVSHGETVRETATMISFLTEVIGIRDDMYIGEGHTYMKMVSDAVREGFREGILPQLPAIVNLQCDIDHPTQTMADLMHLVRHFGGVDKLRGKKITMSWAYSPSYGKPLSVPQGVIGLMTRFGMHVVLAHPEGYGLMPRVMEIAVEQSEKSGGSFEVTDSMEEAFSGAHIVYPKSWAPYHVMEKRTTLLSNGDIRGLEVLEKECLEYNKKYIDWECTQSLMKRADDALYLHCLPADISGVSCERGEVEASVFERFRKATYTQAGYKPYIIAAVIFLSKVKDPAAVLSEFSKGTGRRVF